MTRTLVLALAVVFPAACGRPAESFLTTCPGTAVPAASDATVALELPAVASAAPVSLDGATLVSPGGLPYQVTMLRYYLSEPRLVRSDGSEAPAVLTGADGQPLPFNLAFVDHGVHASTHLSLRVPPGDYTAFTFTLGVPAACASGEELNHGDASARGVPLDVDTGMYWSWDPGYVFFKVEGRVQVGGAWKPFFYHVGEDARRLRLSVPLALATRSGATTAARVTLDVNRLFQAADGALRPRLGEENTAHGGPVADQVAANLAGSGVFSAR